MDDPKRLLSSLASTSLERALLDSAVDNGPTAAECAALWVSLSHHLSAGSESIPRDGGLNGGGAGAAATAGLGALVKGILVLVLVAGAALVAAYGIGWRRGGEDRTPMSTARVASEPAPVMAPEPPAAVPAVAPDFATVAAPDASSSPAPPARKAKAAKASRGDGSVRAESALLLAARRALRTGDCSAALARLGELRARFPAGVLAQERDALGVEALRCAGRADEATERAAQFILAYPASPYADLVMRAAR